jgi:(p)ppGpp synthase/HD superfamily hydrolase
MDGYALSEAFEQAFVYAVHVHGGHVRKGSDIPYVAHLMAVCALVLEAGGTEPQAVAALLHDAAEDFGGDGRLADIRSRFGDRVANIVEECSDSLADDPADKAPWVERKKRYVDHLAGTGGRPKASADALLVSLADKLHNARAILRDQHRVGDAVFGRFTSGQGDAQQGRKLTIRYYVELEKVFAQRRGDVPAAGQVLVDELGEIVNEMQEHARTPTTRR